MWLDIKEPTLRFVLLSQRSIGIADPIPELLKRLLVFKIISDVSSCWFPSETRLMWLHSVRPSNFWSLANGNPVLTRDFPNIVSFYGFLWKWTSEDRDPYAWRRICNMSTGNLGPAVPCGPPCPAAVYGKGIYCIDKIVKKPAREKNWENTEEGWNPEGYEVGAMWLFVCRSLGHMYL